MPLDVVIVSGLWPPDVGGPASHGPQFGAHLVAAGDRVRAVTTADDAGAVAPAGFPVHALPRELPLAARMAAASAAIARAAWSADVVYATGLYSRAAAAARTTRTPLVLKLVNDPAFERARWTGRFDGTPEEFQATPGDARIRALRALRDRTLAAADHVVVPGEYLARLVRGWGLPAERVTAIPNPAPVPVAMPPREELRRALGLERPTLVFAGRLVVQKDLPRALRALARVDGVDLVLVGDGPERAAVERQAAHLGVGSRVRLVGAVGREEAMRWMAAADAFLLPSAWEGFPHAAVEALAVGTPVIATAVGGVPEIVDPGRNGILVAHGDEAALGEAMAAVRDAPALARLREGAHGDAQRFRPEAVFATLRDVLVRTSAPVRSSQPRWSLIADLARGGESLLDVGCRDRALREHLPEGVRYVGLDLFPPADVIANAEEPLPFADGSFDVVVFADVLEHLDDPHGALDEGLRVARRAVVVLLPNMYSLLHRVQYARGRTATDKYAFTPDNRLDRHRWLMSHEEAAAFTRARAERAGWRVAEEYGYDGDFRRPLPRLAYAAARLAGSANLWSWEYAARLEPAGPEPRATAPAGG